MDTPERRAIRKYCATATPQGCALYTGDVTSCRAVAGAAYSILLTQRLWRSKGSSPEEAARLSLDGISRGNPSPSGGDLVTIARRAQSFPLTSQPQEFSDQILNDCIASASRLEGCLARWRELNQACGKPRDEISVMAKVNFTQCAVAFLDILGFKDFIAVAEVTGSKEFVQFSQLLNAIDRQLQSATDGQEQHTFPKDVGLTTIHISDSFVLSALINNESRPVRLQ